MTANMTDATKDVPLRVADPELIPAARYYDEAFFKLEKEKLWPHVWQMACRLEEIPEVGDFTEYTIFEKSVIVVRTKSGIKAFHNTCRHRGVRLATGPGNCAKSGFVCPFHGWRWNPEGKNTFVFSKQIFNQELLDHAEIDLKPCRIEKWIGCAFINFDDNAPSLRDSMGQAIYDRFAARNVEKLKMDWWYATELPTNWKLAMEAFMEGYHVMRTHPQLHALSTKGSLSYGTDFDDFVPNRDIDARQAVNLSIDSLKRIGEGMAGLVHQTEIDVLERLRDMDIPDDPMAASGAMFAKAMEEVRDDGLARGAPMFDIPKVMAEYPFHGVEFMFPHFFLLPMFAAMSSYRIRPLTAETCYFEIWSLVLRPEGEEFDTPKEATFLAYDSPDYPEIPAQDYSNLPLQQLGLHGGGFEHMRLSKDFEGLISNYQRLIDGYLAGLDPQKLAKAANVVNDGYESPIHDIGF